MLDRPAETVDIRLESEADPLQIIYTSGTTGDPKGVVMQNGRYGGMSMLGRFIFQFQPTDKLYTGLSLTHGNAQAVTLSAALCIELPAVISRRFTKSRLWDICRKHGCTTFSQLGGMATAIYSEPVKENDADNPVRMLTSAGMPHAIWEAFEKRFDLKIFEWYGAVEGGLAFKPIGQGPIGSFGKPGPGLEMKILDENDEECPPFVPGEICSRPATGESAEVEYHGNPEASEKKTRGGWLRSGDIGHTDEEGWLFFDYRKGGGIRRSGDFVNPGFVEKVIAEHPDVSDVCVYGIPAKSGAPGEKDVVAAIVPVAGEEHRSGVGVRRSAGKDWSRTSSPPTCRSWTRSPRRPRRSRSSASWSSASRPMPRGFTPPERSSAGALLPLAFSRACLVTDGGSLRRSDSGV